jgi:PQQ-dependent catabolism-associated CXXCW motif protein
MRMEEAIDALGEPYPGLRSFRRDETHIFFGREGTISEMVDRLAAHRFLAVTGLSGSGKSSLVKTGLLDALDRGLLVEAGSDWRVVDFRPGAQPLTRMTVELTRALEKSFSDPELGLIEAKLASGPLGLVAWLDEIDFPSDTNILLLVDQFEELFRYRQGQSGDDIDAFVALLLASAKQRKRRIYVVITMRSDFLGDCARFTDLAETINDGQFLTPRLTREQCKEAIEGPAAVYGGEVEPALVTHMLNDMGGNPDQLPLMQHILMLLWQRAKARSATAPVLTLDDYKALGGIGTDADKFAAGYGRRPSLLRRIFGRSAAASAGVETTGVHSFNGALSDHADRVLAELTPEQQRLAEILFRALTQGEGEGGRDVRRPITLAKAAAIAQVPVSDLIPIIKAFGAPGRNFLIPAEPDALAAETTTVDISHESLIRQWVTLRRWVRQEFISAENYRHIERRAKQWQLGLGNLLMKLDLAGARRWRKVEHPNTAWADRYGDAFDFAMAFLRKSERHRFWRRGIITLASILVASGAVLSTLYLTTVMTTGLSYVNPADEFSNFGVAAQGELKRAVGTNTPRTIPGGKVMTTAELETALSRGTLEDVPFRAIDAWRRSDSKEVYIPESIYIEYAGEYGTFDDNIQLRLKEELTELTNGNLDMPLVFFCIGATCWESYNAALRAIKLGYTKVYWYRGGISSWQAAHRPYALDLSRVHITGTGMITTVRTIRQAIWPDPDFHYKLGLDYADSRLYESAVEAFSEAIERNPNHVDAYYHRALAHTSKQRPDYDDALDDLFKVMELDSGRSAAIQKILSDRKYAAGYNIRGNIQHQKGAYDAAIKEYDLAISLDPEYAIAYRNRGLAYHLKRNYDLAIQDYDQAIRLNPKDSDAFNGRGSSYFAKADYQRAIEDYGEAIRIGPRIAVFLANRGLGYVRVGNHDLALADYDEAIKIQPDAATYNRRGYAYFAKHDDEHAIADYARALKLDPKLVTAYVNRGNSYLRSGNYDRAIEDLSEAIGLAAQNAEIFNDRGLAYSRKHAYDAAIKDFDQAIALAPKFAAAYNYRGNARYYKGDYDGAIGDFEKAIELGADKSTAYDNLGKVYFAKHDFERAIEEYGKAIALQPDDGNALSGQAWAEIYAKRIEAAIAHLTAALKLEESYPYHAIWLHMARMRAGLVNREELAANTEKIDRSRWPWPVIALFLGASAPEMIHIAARSVGTTSERDDQLCEADFYLGFHRLANGERAEARRLLEAVVNTCPRHNTEYQLGRIELERLR